MTLPRPDARVGFAGDWHGNSRWATSRIDRYAAAGVRRVYQVGDFGLWPGASGTRYLLEVNAACERGGVTVLVIPGNHEDYTQLEAMTPDLDGWLVDSRYPRILFAPRGHTWLDEGVRFAALGGAGSIDRNTRVEGQSWWAQEEITDEDCATLTRNVAARGWDRVDVLLTHEAPAGLRRSGMTPLPRWATQDVQAYCYAQRVRLRDAVDAVAPFTLVHGHWHEEYRDTLEGVSPLGADYTCEVYGLSADGDVRSCMLAEISAGHAVTNVGPVA